MIPEGFHVAFHPVAIPILGEMDPEESKEL